MATIGILGYQGFVGSSLYAEFQEHTGDTIVGIEKDTYSEFASHEFDVLINCAMPSGKFWAMNNPLKDFAETVEKTANLIYTWKFKKFVQISTASARCQLNTIYGRHKAAAEKICNFEPNLIVRLGAIYSPANTKGVLVDILKGNTVFAGGESRYSFIPLEFCTSWIAAHLDRTGIVELGGRNPITLQAVADHIGRNIAFDGEIVHLDVENTEDDLPEAGEVLQFMDNIKNYD